MCGCGGRINGVMKSNSNPVDLVVKMGSAIIAGSLGYKGGEMLTQHVEYLTKNPLMSGFLKVGAAVGTAAMFPEVVQNEWGTGALVGLGISGGQELLKEAGIKGIGSSNFNESRYLNPNAYNKTAKSVNGGVRVEYQ